MTQQELKEIINLNFKTGFEAGYKAAREQAEEAALAMGEFEVADSIRQMQPKP